MKTPFATAAPTADFFIPDDCPWPEAAQRITHLGIGAHQDDLEFMAYHGILECFDREDRWFGGIICSNGQGSSRTGPHAHRTDADLARIRCEEQRLAARIGQYGLMVQLGYPSSEANDPTAPGLSSDLATLLRATRPQVLYTHNPADKHPTHLGVFSAVWRALRSLSPEERPPIVYGCEVWRDLDWLPDDKKVLLDVSGREHLAAALNGVFDSQIAGGKRYDLAVAGRRRAHATFLQPHASDQVTGYTIAMDLSPLAHQDDLDPVTFVSHLLHEFTQDVQTRLRHHLG